MIRVSVLKNNLTFEANVHKIMIVFLGLRSSFFVFLILPILVIITL